MRVRSAHLSDASAGAADRPPLTFPAKETASRRDIYSSSSKTLFHSVETVIRGRASACNAHTHTRTRTHAHAHAHMHARAHTDAHAHACTHAHRHARAHSRNVPAAVRGDEGRMLLAPRSPLHTDVTPMQNGFLKAKRNPAT